MMMPSILEKTYLMTGWTSHSMMILTNISLERKSVIRKTCKKYDENRCKKLTATMK